MCSPYRATPDDCRNGVLDPGEECDPSVGWPDTCRDFGLEGTAQCNLDCTVRCDYACGDGIVQGDEECDDGNVAGNDGCDATCLPEALRWEEYPSETSPPARSSHAMAYDQDNQIVVLFGGRARDDSNLADTWIFDGETWTELPFLPDAAPCARAEHAMAYDPDRRVTVLYGGQGPGETFKDVWEFDGVAWQRAGDAPTERKGAAMAFQPSLGLVVAAGCNRGSDPKPGSWLYDGDWAPLDEALPWSRGYAAVAAAPSSATLPFTLVHGGRASTLSVNEFRTVADSWWLHDGAWKQLDPTKSGPEREKHAAVYLPRWGKVVLFGGKDPHGTLRKDSWVLNHEAPGASNWHRVPGSGPSPREAHTMVLDTARDRIVLFGGLTASGASDETWFLY